MTNKIEKVDAELPLSKNKWQLNYIWQSDNKLRIEAKAKGEMYYTRAQPCRKGHFSPRYVKQDKCIACMKEGKLKFRKNNPEKTKYAN